LEVGALSARCQNLTNNNNTGPSNDPAAHHGRLYKTWEQSLIVSILSAGTFFGALFAGALADWIGRRSTMLAGCAVFMVGVGLQVGAFTIALLAAGRLLTGIGMGFISAVLILYMSEIASKAVRGAIVAGMELSSRTLQRVVFDMIPGYQFCITVGFLLASIVEHSLKDRMHPMAYRIPIGIQLVFAVVLGAGLFFLPDSPRWYVKRSRLTDAARSLSKLRGHPAESQFVQDELGELVANYKYEMIHMQSGWMDCFRGGSRPSSNLRRVMLGIALQMMQQWTGGNLPTSFVM
jgi:MFS family permease